MITDRIGRHEILSPINHNFTLGTRGFFREFSVLAEGRSHERRSAGHYKDLIETGNRARKVSGTQGIITLTKFVIYKVLFKSKHKKFQELFC